MYFLELGNHNLYSPSVAYTIHGTLFWYTPVLAIHRFWHELVYTGFGYSPLLAFDFSICVICHSWQSFSVYTGFGYSPVLA